MDNLIKRPWYKHWWGALLGIIGIFVALYLIYFLSQAVGFYLKVKKGEITADGSVLAGGFTTTENLRKGLAPLETDLDLATADDPQIGAAGAPLEIVEFADFGCPFSREQSFIIREFAAKNSSKIHYTYRDFPILELHPEARAAAEAAECAGEQGKFWEYHDKLYQNQYDLSGDALKVYAVQIGLDEAEFGECFSSGRYRDEVEEDYQAGLAAGVRGTPTFFLNGKRVEGSIPREAWEQILSVF